MKNSALHNKLNDFFEKYNKKYYTYPLITLYNFLKDIYYK